MINVIWFVIFAFGIMFGIFTGRGEEVSKIIMTSANSTVKLMIGLVGIISLWCGVMKIAVKSGLINKIGIILKPILNIIFKKEGKNNKSLGYIVMNITANMLGISNAATPFGIKAMEEMQKFNLKKDTASDDMALFLVLNSSCIQLVPTTIISIRAAVGSKNPAIIIIPSIIATGIAGIVGIICCKILERYF